MIRLMLCLSWLWLASCTIWVQTASGQTRAISTAAPTLAIPLEPRVLGFGDIATVSPIGYYAAGLDGNPALLEQGSHSYGGQANVYFPRVINPILDDISYYLQAGAWGSITDRSTLAFSAQYFDFGEIILTNEIGDPVGVERPCDLNANLRYALQASDQVSLGIGMKLFYSTLGSDKHDSLNYFSGAADVGVWYHDQQQRKGYTLHWQVGATVADLGPKVSYSPNWGRDFIPTRLEIGLLGGVSVEDFSFDVAYQAQKLMVPSVKFNAGGQYIGGGGRSDLPLLEGMFTSFGDSDLGLEGELQEIIHQVGLEQRYQSDGWLLAMRQGLFLEHANYGNRRYISLGISAGYAGIRFDLGTAWRWKRLYKNNPSFPGNGLSQWTFGVAFTLPEE